MKIILTTKDPDLGAEIDPRFGRGANFVIVDPDTLQWQGHPNPAISASGGAGTLAAQFVADQQAEAVISGDFGPNAYNALHAAGVAMYLYGTCSTVQQAIERFKAGELQRVGAPTGPGHHRRS